MIFVEGAPRSGTTLLISLLATHPDIAATVAESHLFDRGIGELFDNFERPERYERFLSGYVSEQRLTELLRDLCDGVLDSMRERVKPGASRVAEKTPMPRFGAEEVMRRKLEIYPGATYVHVVRERAAVVGSLLRAPWAEVGEREAAVWWRQAVDAIRATAGAAPEARYVEIAYERLAAEPVDVAADLFEQLGLAVDAEIRSRLEAAARERISAYGSPAAAGPDAAPAPGGSAPAPVGGGRGQGGVEAAPARPSLRRRAAGALRRLAGRRSPEIEIVQALVVAARSGDRDEIVALTDPGLAFELRSGSGDLIASGDDARDALLALAGRLFAVQAVSESWSGVSEGAESVLLFAAAYGDGTRADLAVSALVRGGVVERLAVLAAGEPGPRTPRPLDSGEAAGR